MFPMDVPRNNPYWWRSRHKNPMTVSDHRCSVIRIKKRNWWGGPLPDTEDSSSPIKLDSVWIDTSDSGISIVAFLAPVIKEVDLEIEFSFGDITNQDKKERKLPGQITIYDGPRPELEDPSEPEKDNE